MQNGLHLLQDRLTMNLGLETIDELSKNYAHSWDVYIGNDPIWSNNPKCPGGPHLKSTYDDYFDKYASFYY